MSCTCTQDTACDNAMPGSIEVKGDLILHEGSTLNFGCCDDDCNCQSGGCPDDPDPNPTPNPDPDPDADTYLVSVVTSTSGLSTLTMNSGNTFTIQQAVTSVNGQTGDVAIDTTSLGLMPYQQITALNQTADAPTTVNFNTQDFSLKRDVHALILRDGSAGSNVVTIADFDSSDSVDFTASALTVFDSTMHPEQKQETISMTNIRATGSGRTFSHMISFADLNDILVEEI